MDKKRRTSIVGGALLILVGGLLFAGQVFPDYMPDFWEIISWPWFIIGLFLRLLWEVLAESWPTSGLQGTLKAGLISGRLFPDLLGWVLC